MYIKANFINFVKINQHSSTMANSKIYSRNKLSQMMDQNEEEVDELMKIFVQMVPEMLREMRDFAELEKWPECSDVAHKMKSSMRLWDMDVLDEDVVYIETHGMLSENTESIRERIQNLNTQLLQAVQQMQLEIS